MHKRYLIIFGILSAALPASVFADPVVTTTAASALSVGAQTAKPSNLIANDLQVTVQTGSDWTNSQLTITLTSGGVYNNAADTSGTPNTVLWQFIPSLEYDTFVNSKGFTTASIAGKNPDDGAGAAQGLTTDNVQVISAAWFNNTPGEDGTFTIGRFTFTNTSNGTFSGASFDSTAPGTPQRFSGTIVNGVMILPEPGTIGVLGIAAGTLLLRRRRT